jgi:hypothetical protein
LDTLTFSYSSDGSVLVCSDGPELFAYYAGDGGPAWSAFLDRPLLGLTVVGQEVLGLSDVGTLTSWNAQDGGVLWASELGQTTGRLAVSASRSIAVYDGSSLRVFRADGSSAVIEVEGVSSFGWCGEEVLIGTTRGTVECQNAGGWRVLATLPSAVREVCGAGPDRWAAGADGELVVGTLAGAAPDVVASIAGCHGLTVSRSGDVVAVCVGDGKVVIMEGFGGEVAGHIQVKRPVAGIAFGPERSLGIGLDDGDASHIDVASSTVVHTTAHAGRAKSAWHVTVQLQPAVLRGAKAMHVTKGASVATYTGVRPDEDKPSRFRWWMGVAGLLLLVGLGGVALLVLSATVLWMRGLA